MKTITEFSGFDLRRGLLLRAEILPKPERSGGGGKIRPKGTIVPKTESASSSSEPTPALPSTEDTPPAAETAEVSPPEVSEATHAAEAPPVAEETASAPSPDERLKTSITEKLKFEGEKLDHFLKALDVVDIRRKEDLRRVVVWALAEGEKPTGQGVQKDLFFYVSDYMASLHRPKERGGKGKDRGRGPRDGKKKKKGRFGDKGRRPPRDAQGPRSGPKPTAEPKA